MKKDEKNGNWRTTNFSEGDNFGVMGDRLRVVAACYLHKDNPRRMIIVLGGRGQLSNIPGAPTVASVIKKELAELNVPENLIVTEENSSNTYHQLLELKNIVQEMRLQKLIVVSSRYHLPRVQAMLENLPELKTLRGICEINFVSAEDVVAPRDERWREIIKSVYESEDMKARIRLEEKGTKDIKEGKYEFM